MVGRGTRLHPDKKNLLLLDFLWMHERHDLARPASLVAKNKQEEKSITDLLLEGSEKSLEEAVTDAAEEREAALIRQIAENARRREKFISLEQAGALLHDKEIQDYEPVFGWEQEKPTAGQLKILDAFGISCKTKGEATQLMNKLFERSRSKLATVKQLKWLITYKHPSPHTCTQKEAKDFLDERWKKTV